MNTDGGVLGSDQVIAYLKACPAKVAAWLIGTSYNALGMSSAPRNEDRTYNAAAVVAHRVAKAASDAIESHSGGPKADRGDAATIKDEALAAKYLIEVGEASKLLLRRADVETAITRAIVTFKQTLTGAPHTWPPAFVGKDEKGIKAALTVRVDDILRQLETDLAKALTGQIDDDEEETQPSA